MTRNRNDWQWLKYLGMLSASMAISQPALAADSLDAIQGMYTNRLAHPSPGPVEVDTSKETLTIIKLSSVTAYFEAVLDRCYLSGIAELQPGGSLLYREDVPKLASYIEEDDHTSRLVHSAREHYWCELGIHPGSQKITFSDPADPQDQQEDNFNGACAVVMCGGINGFVSTHFKRSTHRNITPKKAAAIKKSEEFQKALKKREMYLNHITPDPI